ncbi:MAG TPA: phytochelatin synthase family protein [Polyangiaceae bacterium]|jgi:hypothetical protein|nr:phytochelatin synthase family protein [Polyangiaceae bacterium]
MRLFSVVFAALLASLLTCGSASAQHSLLPDSVVALDSPEGAKLFDGANAKVDYFALSGAYVTQQTQAFCGVASAVMVLNAMQVLAPTAPAWEPYHSFTQDNVFNATARAAYPPDAVNRGGMTLDQLADLFQSHPARAKAVHARGTNVADFRREAVQNLKTAGDYIVINYDRGPLGMETSGHFSPLGAYNEAADKFLIMDVARYKYPPYWADAAQVFAAMSGTDLSSGDTRGYLVVTRSETAPGPIGARARSPLRMLVGIVAAAFALGGAVGAAVATIFARRRARRLAKGMH